MSKFRMPFRARPVALTMAAAAALGTQLLTGGAMSAPPGNGTGAANAATTPLSASGHEWGNPGVGLFEFADDVRTRAIKIYRDRYAEMWVSSDQSHFEIGVVDLTPADSAQAARDFAGLPPVTLVERKVSRSSVDRAVSEVDALLPTGATLTSNYATGTVIVTLPPGSERRPFVDTVTKSSPYGIQAGNRPPTGDATKTIRSHSSADPQVAVWVQPTANPRESQGTLPMRAGKRIMLEWPGRGALCTSAFAVNGGAGGQYALTAGHCGPAGSNVWLYKESTSTKTYQFSNLQNNSFWGTSNNNGDSAVFYLNGQGANHPSVFLSSSAMARIVTAQAAPVVGMRVCARGATSSGELCGTVQQVSTTVYYDSSGVPDGLSHTVSNVFWWSLDSGAVIPGDSGGPVYAVNPDGTAVAVGVTSGSASGGSTEWSIATDVSTALATTGTSLASSLGRPPFGSIDLVSGGDDTIRVAGWALDPDMAFQAISVHVYVGGPAGSGAPGYAITADGARPDVAATYPAAGPNHGFDRTLPGTPGSIPVYVYAIDQGSVYAGHTLMWSGTVGVW